MAYGYGLSASLFQMAHSYTAFSHDGEVIPATLLKLDSGARVQGVRRFIEMIGDNPRLTATALQTVGIKGWDGFTLALVNG